MSHGRWQRWRIDAQGGGGERPSFSFLYGSVFQTGGHDLGGISAICKGA